LTLKQQARSEVLEAAEKITCLIFIFYNSGLLFNEKNHLQSIQLLISVLKEGSSVMKSSQG